MHTQLVCGSSPGPSCSNGGWSYLEDKCYQSLLSYLMASAIYPFNNWDQDDVTCKSFQYADKPTFFSHAKVSDLSGAIDDMSRTLDCLGAYSRESDLAVIATKTKWMLVSSPQISFYHSLIIQCNGNALGPWMLPSWLQGVYLHSRTRQKGIIVLLCCPLEDASFSSFLS